MIERYRCRFSLVWEYIAAENERRAFRFCVIGMGVTLRMYCYDPRDLAINEVLKDCSFLFFAASGELEGYLVVCAFEVFHDDRYQFVGES